MVTGEMRLVCSVKKTKRKKSGKEGNTKDKGIYLKTIGLVVYISRQIIEYIVESIVTKYHRKGKET